MSNDLVSVIILDYNGKDMLVECLEAVFRQTYPNYEVIVVDNASKDSSEALVCAKFPKVHLLVLEKNHGFAGGNNRGMEMASGKYIALLNNDAVPEPQWLEELVRALEKDPTAGFCASKLLVYGGEGLIDTVGDGWATVGVGFKHGKDQREGEAYSRLRYVFSACAAAALYQRSMIDEIGGFDEDFFFSCEDTDLAFRAQLAGYRCLYVPLAVVHHRVGASSRDLSFLYYMYYRNLEYVYFKNMPQVLLWKYLPLHLLYVFCSFAASLLRRTTRVFLRAKLHFLLNVPKVWRKRRAVQRSRKVSINYLESIMRRGYLIYRLKEEFSSDRPPRRR
jgi:GT2 family glycosyltransferase